jgi:hypothetical protein
VPPVTEPVSVKPTVAAALAVAFRCHPIVVLMIIQQHVSSVSQVRSTIEITASSLSPPRMGLEHDVSTSAKASTWRYVTSIKDKPAVGTMPIRTIVKRVKVSSVRGNPAWTLLAVLI